MIPVRLNGSRNVRDTASIEEGEPRTDHALLNVYANRQQYSTSSEVHQMNFLQFATYKVVNEELSKLPDNIIQYFQHIHQIQKAQILDFTPSTNR